MNVKNIRSKKALKLLGLLVSALVIATASAQLYDTLYMRATPISVEGVGVKFTAGNETSLAGGTINTAGSEVTFTGMQGKPGFIKTYGQAVNMTNMNSTGDFKIELKLNQWDGGASSKLTCINITVYDDAGDKQGTTINLIPAETGITTTGELTIPASKVWSVEWAILWNETATPGTDEVNVTLELIAEKGW